MMVSEIVTTGKLLFYVKNTCAFLHIYTCIISYKIAIIVYKYTIMNDYQRKKIEMELKSFTSRNFEKPAECKNLLQIRFYVEELCSKIDEYQNRFNYVPGWVYGLLAQYNARQNQMIQIEFRNTYH